MSDVVVGLNPHSLIAIFAQMIMYLFIRFIIGIFTLLTHLIDYKYSIVFDIVILLILFLNIGLTIKLKTYEETIVRFQSVFLDLMLIFLALIALLHEQIELLDMNYDIAFIMYQTFS